MEGLDRAPGASRCIVAGARSRIECPDELEQGRVEQNPAAAARAAARPAAARTALLVVTADQLNLAACASVSVACGVGRAACPARAANDPLAAAFPAVASLFARSSG